jgi:diguanylate cyclase (GGDEF)-like protein
MGRYDPRWNRAPLDVMLRQVLVRAAETFRVPMATLSIELGTEFRSIVYESSTLMHGSLRDWNIGHQVLTSREMLVIHDLAGDTRYRSTQVSPVFPVQGLVAAPLVTSEGKAIGVLSLMDSKPLTLSPAQLRVLPQATRRIADAVERQYQANAAASELDTHWRSEERWAELERLALTDPLTGLANRRAGEQALQREAARASRHASPFSLALVDVDHFKSINDAGGHKVGDDVLIRVSHMLRAGLRASDLVVRWGGDEFLILLPDVDLTGARIFAERARQQVSTLRLSADTPITICAGVVEVAKTEPVRDAVARADAELYRAKRSGRNRIQTPEA